MTSQPDIRNLIIAGDMTIDWNLARFGQSKSGVSWWNPAEGVEINAQPGGAALLISLVNHIATELKTKKNITTQVFHPRLPQITGEITLTNPDYHHSYAIFSEKKYSEKFPQDKEKAWRVDEFLGLHRAVTPQNSMLVEGDPGLADLVVFNDDNLGFRNSAECWPAAIKNPEKTPGWFVMKMANPVAQGKLWEELHGQHAERMLVVTTAYDLRMTEVQISRELSWERTAQDIFWELMHNPCINALSHCAHVVVSFGAAGAILLSRQPGGTSKCSLVFDPGSIEGSWEKDHPGRVIGYTSCLMAGVVRQLLINPVNPDISKGIQGGLTALRLLHTDGYGEKGKPPSLSPLVFPFERIASCLSQDPGSFACVDVQDPMRFIKQSSREQEKPLIPGFWTILQDRYQGTLDQVAEQIVRVGPDGALRDVPMGQFGNLLTVDRQEIESFRSIRSLVGEYCQGVQKKPLSIAVFGAPGSGKSFGIVEVATSLLPGQIEVREFNLSQFTGLGDLTAAFHQVRDIGLNGKIPLIFWDEFDTNFADIPLGWLRYFLAPMQDGRFQEAQINHPIGRSIFVFAGGTSACMSEFGSSLSKSEFKSAKGPDFISRLKGYVNILGPNPVNGQECTPGRDPYFIIRRAILIRSILKRNTPALFEREKLNIDSGVLRALLRTRLFRHGVRSIESIISMSQLAGKKSFERSCLPSESQLDLHVDGQDFLALVQQLELSGQELEMLAEVAHEVYRESVKDKGQQTYPASMSYPELPENFKEQNRQNIRDIPSKLAFASYAMIPARSNEPPFNFPGDALEVLAEKEHERWMQVKLADGWTYAPQTDKERKLNQCLVPWSDLPDVEKEKDREMVRSIPRILARGGYAVVKTRG